MTEAEIDDLATSPYCEECNSCGESGCCSPSNCALVRCKYGEYNLREYKSMEKQLDDYYKVLKDVQKYLAWQDVECSSLETRKLSEKITKLFETDYTVA